MTSSSNDYNTFSSPNLNTEETAPLLPSHNAEVSTSPNDASKAYSFKSESINIMNTIVTGATFGAALVASGVYQPSVIIGQLELKNWHMLQAFLTATGSSAVFIMALEKMGYCRQTPRQATTLNIFANHDGNIVGGALLGTGMALAGACPGTVLAQVGVGIKSGYYALDGAILAGLFWKGFLQPVLKPCHPKPEVEGQKVKLTVHEHIKCPRTVMLIGFEALCVAAVGATVALAPASTTAKISPVLGGILIGLSQLWSLVTRKNLLGASTAYEEVANYVLWLLRGAGVSARPNTYKNIVFAAGAASGAWAVGKFLPELVEGAAVNVHPALAIGGGFLMVLGARIAGGCTSGHGISGMSMFSLSSFVTIGTALAIGVLTRSVVLPALTA